uniref:Kelch-like protein 1 n=1 Tax=Zeugodacus cucurbitae TaxID=28588 RepID=A0A0A1WF54_ZEUCU
MSKRLEAEHCHEPPVPFKKYKSKISELLVMDIENERLNFVKIVPERRVISSYPLCHIRNELFHVVTQNNHIFLISQESEAIYSLDLNNNMGNFKFWEAQSIGGTGAILHGLLYVICGQDRYKNITQLMECYDLQTKKRLSKNIPKMNYLLNGVGLIAHEDTDRLYVIGGRNEKTNLNVSKVQAYSAAKNTWTELRCMKYARYRPALVVYLNSIYVIGGYVENGKSYMERYDILEDTWNRLEPLSVMYAKVEIAKISAIVYEGRIVAFGLTPDFNVVIEEYNPDDNKWRQVQLNCSSHTPILCDITHLHIPFSNETRQPLSAYDIRYQ